MKTLTCFSDQAIKKMWLFWSTLLLIVVCNEHVWSKVIRDAAKASSEPTAAPRIETAKKTVHLQANTLELRYAVTKDANSKVVSLRVSAECSQFLDKMYLAIAFSAQGAMVPSLALAGEKNQSNNTIDI